MAAKKNSGKPESGAISTGKMINRIRKHEKQYDRLQRAVTLYGIAVAELVDARSDYDDLEGYLDGKWKDDFEADEAGRLPENLKRGVLSEDGLWNLLNDYDYIVGKVITGIGEPEDDEEEDLPF